MVKYFLLEHLIFTGFCQQNQLECNGRNQLSTTNTLHQITSYTDLNLVCSWFFLNTFMIIYVHIYIYISWQPNNTTVVHGTFGMGAVMKLKAKPASMAAWPDPIGDQKTQLELQIPMDRYIMCMYKYIYICIYKLDFLSLFYLWDPMGICPWVITSVMDYCLITLELGWNPLSRRLGWTTTSISQNRIRIYPFNPFTNKFPVKSVHSGLRWSGSCHNTNPPGTGGYWWHHFHWENPMWLLGFKGISRYSNVVTCFI